MIPTDDWLLPFRDHLVVADLDQDYLVIGRLVTIGREHLEFTDADLHDHGEANCTKEVYCLESQKIGVRSNRARVAIPRTRLIAISRLEDV